MRRSRGFILLAVVLTMSLVAVLAYMLNRENGTQANRDRSIADTDRARYAAEAGLLAVNARIQARDCSDFPTAANKWVNNDFEGASYKAYSLVLNVTGAQPITLVSTGSYNGTDVTLTRSKTYAYKNSVQSYQFQPDNLSGTDTYLTSNSTFNFGGSDLMPISGGNSLLLKFDLAGTFPAGAIPDTPRPNKTSSESLTLKLTNDSGSDVSLSGASVYRLSGDWAEGTGIGVPINGANWFTSDSSSPWSPGGDFHPTPLNMPYPGMDMSQVAFAWMTGRYPNDGLKINLSGNGNLVLSESASSGRRPYLNFLKYWQPCGTSGPG